MARKKTYKGSSVDEEITKEADERAFSKFEDYWELTAKPSIDSGVSVKNLIIALLESKDKTLSEFYKSGISDDDARSLVKAAFDFK